MVEREEKAVARQRRYKHISAAIIQHVRIEEVSEAVFLCGLWRGYIMRANGKFSRRFGVGG
jgi:hypothetical protein